MNYCGAPGGGIICLSCLVYVVLCFYKYLKPKGTQLQALSRMQAENELSWCARWGALCTISGLRGHRTPSAAEAHCSNNALMYKSTMR